MVYDKDFLLQLDATPHKETYVRIIALDFNELPIEQIEGRVTQGSINIDGNSAVRRTFSLSLVAEDIDINEYLWGIKTKCKLEIGLKNNIDNNYPNIIWFNQGVYIISAFNITNNVNNYTISLSGKDKMCMLNGDFSGSLPMSVDFGVEEFYDKENLITTYRQIPIKEILFNSLKTYAQELDQNIIINDLDETAVELLEYKGDTPLYLLLGEGDNSNSNFTMDGNLKVKVVDGEIGSLAIGTEIKIDSIPLYDPRLNISNEIIENPTIVEINKIRYTVSKITYGHTVGYRLTDLTYAGELIANIGDSLTSIYDKIVAMLGGYEYFYDIDGHFVFQRKRNYLQTSWNNLINNGDGQYAEANVYSSSTIYDFDNNLLISSFQNQPQLNNLKNDFSIWGTRETISGAEIPIHYRYAIDKKPERYTSIEVSKEEAEEFSNKHPGIIMRPQVEAEAIPDGEDKKKYNIKQTYDIKDYDWREIIYQMAKDYYAYNQLEDFASRVKKANSKDNLYTTGKTEYEQYYIDIYGFWRQLYNPFEEIKYKLIDSIPEDAQGLYTKGGYAKKDVLNLNQQERKKLFALITVGKSEQLHPLLDAIQLPDYEDSFVIKDNDTIVSIYKDELNRIISQIVEKTIEYESITDEARKEAIYKELNELEEERKGLVNKPYKSNKYYIYTGDGYIPININIKDIVQKDEIYIYDISKNDYIKLIMSDDFINTLGIYEFDKTGYYCVDKYDTDIKKLYKNDEGYKTDLEQTALWITGQPDIEKNPSPSVKSSIQYYKQHYEFEEDQSKEKKYWNKEIIENPESLNFWFDFLESSQSELGKYGVSIIGDRAKIVNDKDITSIYFREVPNIIFISPDDYFNKEQHSGYTDIRIQANLEALFKISSQGKSAKDVLDEVLYQHSYCAESVTISALPIYYLQPNTRISVRDDKSKINGEYIINRISIPLAYNGVMQIIATKAPDRLY